MSFSATGESTSLFHYYKKAVFFGEECGAGYYGNTSGFMVMATLPNTKIQVRIPLILYTMAVDGYPMNRGIVPDVPVTPTIEDLLAGRDLVMDRALEFLAEGDRVRTSAAVPVCGLPNFADARAMTSIPIYTECAGVEHNSFMWAYTEPALVEWLFGRQR